MLKTYTTFGITKLIDREYEMASKKIEMKLTAFCFAVDFLGGNNEETNTYRTHANHDADIACRGYKQPEDIPTWGAGFIKQLMHYTYQQGTPNRQLRPHGLPLSFFS